MPYCQYHSTRIGSLSSVTTLGLVLYLSLWKRQSGTTIYQNCWDAVIMMWKMPSAISLTGLQIRRVLRSRTPPQQQHPTSYQSNSVRFSLDPWSIGGEDWISGHTTISWERGMRRVGRGVLKRRTNKYQFWRQPQSEKVSKSWNGHVIAVGGSPFYWYPRVVLNCTGRISGMPCGGDLVC